MMVNLLTQKTREVGVIAEYISDDLSVFIVAQNNGLNSPANGGLRLLDYDSDIECIQDGFRLANLMRIKHDIYSTGFSGGKIVARSSNILLVKEKLISVTSKLLEDLEGRMITGCDLNTNMQDMEKLFKLTPHVLAAINSQVDASSATALGVIGAFEAFQKSADFDISNGVLVHGCGAVGKIVAEELVKKGVKTFVVDKDVDRTNISGTISLEYDKNWFKRKFDVLIPCSISGLIDTQISPFLVNKKAIIPAANAPFTNKIIPQKLIDLDVTIIPDPIVNAGAVIADSIERYSPDAWDKTSANKVYSFIKDTIRKKSFAFLSLVKSGLNVEESIQLIREEDCQIIGKTF
tara:strand:+ start:2509 stop:3555 length:1047 start_codon:yes stop_codon:yes gene_type:complete